MHLARDIRHDRRLMAYTAAAMYGAAAFDGCIQGFLPGDPRFALGPVIVVVAMTGLLLLAGGRLPVRVLALLGPLGVALTAYVVADQPGASDGAVLYAMPVLWTTLFFGRRGAAAIVSCVAAGQAVALLALPAASAYPGRWVDVMVSAIAIAVVGVALEERNGRLVQRLDHEARTDPLTGLLNRRSFQERAAAAVDESRRRRQPVALVALDIDHFKSINDEWGHDAGDRVLARIGDVLHAEGREIDILARLGGEEFAALLPGSDALGGAAFAQRVRTDLAATVAADAGALPPVAVRVSAGVTADSGSGSVRDLLERADEALYEAKRGGRDRIVVFAAGRAPAGAGGQAARR